MTTRFKESVLFSTHFIHKHSPHQLQRKQLGRVIEVEVGGSEGREEGQGYEEGFQEGTWGKHAIRYVCVYVCMSVCVYVLVTQSCPTFCGHMDCSLSGSSVHRILQARILEWFAIPFARGSSQPGDWTRVSCIASGFFTTEPPGKPIISSRRPQISLTERDFGEIGTQNNAHVEGGGRGEGGGQLNHQGGDASLKMRARGSRGEQNAPKACVLSQRIK